MQRTVRAFLIATTLLHPLAAWAGTPDEAGARKVEEALKTYGPKALSKPGVMRISPEGDGYRLALETAKLIGDALAPMTVKDVAPLAFKLVEQVDGKWAFDSANPFALTTEYLAAGRSASMTLKTETGTIGGLFDPAILFPRRADIGFTEATASLRDSRDALKIGVKDGKLASVVNDLPEGRGDVDGTLALQDVSATHGTFPQPEVKMSAARVDGTYQVGGIDLAGLAAIQRFLQDKAPGKEMTELTGPLREELKALLAKHMPLANSVGGKLTATNLATSEGGKGFKLERLDYETRWEGLGGRAALIIAAHITNLGVDDGVWPKGLEAILPREAALNLRASGFDMSGLWKELASLQTREEAARQSRDHFMRTFLPEGKMIVDFTNSFARSSFYDVTLTGQLQVGRDSRRPPSGTLTVVAKDWDQTIKYLQDNAKTIPIFGQIAMGTTMAKGFGKAGPEGTTVWEIKIEDGGKITVNGQPLPIPR